MNRRIVLGPVFLWMAVSAAMGQLGLELLKNPGFEEGGVDGQPLYWSTSDKKLHRHELADFGGNYIVSSKPEAYVLGVQNVTLEKGKNYTISARIKTTGKGRGGLLLLEGENKPKREFTLLWQIDSEGGFVTVSRTFAAPNPACRLFFYDLSKTGNVSYDYISLKEGVPENVQFRHFGLRQVDKPDGPAPVFPGIAIGKPMSGGPLKAMVLMNSLRQAREVKELENRMDLDVDIVSAGLKGDDPVSFTGNRVTERFPAGYYDCYYVASRAFPGLAKEILENVKKGAGMVYISTRAAIGKDFGVLAGLEELPKSHPLYGIVPWKSHPEGKMLLGMKSCMYGKGRVLEIVIDREIAITEGILPLWLIDDVPWQTRQFAYWENWYSFIAEAMRWAARGENPVVIEQINGDGCAFRVTGKGAVAARVVLRSSRELRFDGTGMIREEPKTVKLNGGIAFLPFPSGFPAGNVFADISVLDNEGKVLGWKTLEYEYARKAVISSWDAEELILQPGGDVNCAVEATVFSGTGKAVIHGRLLDPYNRVLDEKSYEVTNGKKLVNMRLSTKLAGTIYLRVEAGLVLNGVEHDRRWKAISIPELGKKSFEDFAVLPWRPGRIHPHIQYNFTTLMEERIGQNVDFPIGGKGSLNHIEHGEAGAGYIGGAGAFRVTEHREDGIRPRCLNNPETRKAIVENTTKAAEYHSRSGVIAAGITDEAFLSSHHRATEYCFCEYCQAGYREWLKKLYGTIEGLNAQWGTKYKDWGEIVPVRSDDVRGKENFAPFVDFRTYMTDVWIDGCRLVSDTYHKVRPGVPVGHTNTFGVTPFCGNDYWKLATQAGFGWGQEYSEAIKSTAHKAIFEVWRSFTPKEFPNYGWLGYNHSKAAADYECWWLAFHNSRGVSYFATNSFDMGRMTSWALMSADQSPTQFGKYVGDSVRDLRLGVGKLLMEYDRERPQVGLFWSHPSALVAWCESKEDMPEPDEYGPVDSYGSYFRSALDIRQELDRACLDMDYVAPEQIMNGKGLEGRRMLVLPFTVAFPKNMEKKLVDFVSGGGVLVADLRCLRTDEHGTPYQSDAQPLERLFGVKRIAGGAISYKESRVKFVKAGAGIDLTGQELNCYGHEALTAAGAEALAVHDDGTPAVFIRTIGKGLTVYLNFRLAAPKADTLNDAAVIAAIAKAAGIVPAASFTGMTEAGEVAPRCIEVNAFSRNGIRLFGVIRDFRKDKEPETFRIKYDKNAFVYDVRARKYLGNTLKDPAGITLQPGGSTVLAALPYKVDGVKVLADEKSKGLLEIRAAVQCDGKAGLHVFHVCVSDPEGKSCNAFKLNLKAEAGRLEYSLPTGLNRKAGKWTVSVTDVLSGMTGKATVAVQ